MNDLIHQTCYIAALNGDAFVDVLHCLNEMQVEYNVDEVRQLFAKYVAEAA